MQNLRWGILGTGRIARGVAPKIQAAKGCEVVAFASRDPARAAEAARESGLVEDADASALEYDALLERDDVDAVYVTLINSLHAEWCIRALEAGKHVVCEKPLCATLAEARAIFDAARESGRVCVEGFMHLHHPQSQRLRELASGAGSPIGRLRAIRCFRDVMNTDEYILSTRLSHAMEGGAVMDIGCYPISIARFVTGEEPGDDLRAEASFSPPRPGETGRVDETCRFSWTFPSGVTFEGGCSFAREHRVLLELEGERGTVVSAFPFSPDLDVAEPLLVNGAPEVWNDRGDKFTHQFERVALAVRGEAEVLLSPEWSIGQARTIERIHSQIGLRFGGQP